MEGIKKTLKTLCAQMSVSGHEYRAENTVRALCDGIFDEIRRDPMGSFILVKKCGRENAPKLLIDAHLDTVGFMVTEIKDGGFLKIVNVGGLDTRVLPATEVSVYGKREIYGLITSTPPHLRKAGSDKLPEIGDLFIDTGYSKEELEKIVTIGDAVGYRHVFTELLSNYVTTSGLDDKACVCGIIEAMKRADKNKLCYDVYVTLSAQEETGKCGAARASFGIEPDIAIITDVNFARGDGSPDYETIECGKGASIDISSLCDKTLTRNVMKLLSEKSIRHQLICEPGATYTNNERVLISARGVRTLVLSVPLKNMHTPCETVDLEDIKSLGDILLAIAYEENL